MTPYEESQLMIMMQQMLADMVCLNAQFNECLTKLEHQDCELRDLSSHLCDMPRDTSVTPALPVATPQSILNHTIEDLIPTPLEENVMFQPHGHLCDMP
jgi:hypothetical protein